MIKVKCELYNKLPFDMIPGVIYIKDDRIRIVGGINGNGEIAGKEVVSFIGEEDFITDWTEVTNRILFPVSFAEHLRYMDTDFILYKGNLFKTTDDKNLEHVTNLPLKVYYSRVVLVKDKLHIVGGLDTDTMSPMPCIYTATVGKDGSVSEWEVDSSIPSQAHDTSVIKTDKHVYIVGGIYPSGKHCGHIVVGSIKEDGLIRNWNRDNTEVPEEITNPNIAILNDRMFVLGGISHTYKPVNSLLSAPIKEDGTVGEWVKHQDLPIPIGKTKPLVVGSSIYLIGGVTTNNVLSKEVYKVTISN